MGDDRQRGHVVLERIPVQGVNTHTVGLGVMGRQPHSPAPRNMVASAGALMDPVPLVLSIRQKMAYTGLRWWIAVVDLNMT